MCHHAAMTVTPIGHDVPMDHDVRTDHARIDHARIDHACIDHAEQIAACMREADAALARAVLLVDAARTAGTSLRTELPEEVAFSLATGATRWQVRGLLATADTLRAMPVIAGLLARGSLTFSQVGVLASA